VSIDGCGQMRPQGSQNATTVSYRVQDVAPCTQIRTAHSLIVPPR
jgi:hypothetical protein